MRYLALLLTFPLLSSSCQALGEGPAPYRATVMVVMLMQGNSSDVTLGRFDRLPPQHGAYTTSADSRVVLDAAPTDAYFQTKPLIDQCYTEASTYVDTEMGPSWTVEKSNVISGHCWQAGGWRWCDINLEPFEPHAFRILKDEVVFDEYFAPEDALGQPHNVTVTFWVVVQPYHP